MKSAITAKGLTKEYKTFKLGELDFEIPMGFSTALIGANGAGKTTLIDTLCGIIEKTDGEVTYFGEAKETTAEIKERIGYCAAQSFYPADWTAKNIAVSCEAAFKTFNREKFAKLCDEMGVESELSGKKKKNLMQMSDGNKMRIYLASVFARDTDLLVLDEPGSNLDPLMRDRICDRFRQYIDEGDGEKTIIFSTHNISDMEYAADYVIFMSSGKIVEQGFVEDLKEKYIIVRDDIATYESVKGLLLTKSKNATVYSGLALAENKEKAESLGAGTEIPTLQQLSIEILKLAEMNEGK